MTVKKTSSHKYSKQQSILGTIEKTKRPRSLGFSQNWLRISRQ